MSRRSCSVTLFLLLLPQVAPGVGASAPPNDLCVDAIPLDDALRDGTIVYGSTEGATMRPGLGRHACVTHSGGPFFGGIGQPGVWYSVMGTGNRMTVSTCHPGTDYDSQVNIWCSDCDHLVCVAGLDDWQGDSLPGCHLLATCENMACTSSGEACQEDAECPPAVCADGTCSGTGADCELDADCPDPVCQGLCNNVEGQECGPGECVGLTWFPFETLSWCSRAGQEYHILVHGTFGTGNFALSIEDDGVPCVGALDCSQIELVETIVSDNGDDDGWADANETVNLRLSLHNRSGVDLTGVQARLVSDDPRIECIANPVVFVGELPGAETRVMPAGFTFRVADVNRTTLEEELAAKFKVYLSSDQGAESPSERCTVSGLDCSDDADCTQDDLCIDTYCLESGEDCFQQLDCDPPPNHVLSNCGNGTCSISGRDCWLSADIAMEGQVGHEWPLTTNAWSCNLPDVCADDGREIRLELDLDLMGGSGPTAYFEGFESGDFGSFTSMNLDAGLNSEELAEGYRCQYATPESPPEGYWPGWCYFGYFDPTWSDEYFWQVDDGRAFSGAHSLYMGVELGENQYTTPRQILEAAGSDQPINLGWSRSCSISGAACTTAGDCPVGESCLVRGPELSFKHQANLFNVQWGEWQGIWRPEVPSYTFDRAVLQVQLADEDGDPVGHWIKIYPYHNIYRAQDMQGWQWGRCRFDPIDDGSTEDDFFDPLDPGRRYGPSSTCFPEWTFSYQGETTMPFAPENTGWAREGPGLEGEHGLGTWVESSFNLSPFRGQRVRLRFLATTLELSYPTTADNWGPDWPLDDGWWIDDVTITNTLVEPATIVVDEKDNSHLRVDADGDCTGDVSDCDAANAEVWAMPGEVPKLWLSHTGGAGGTTTVSWQPPADHGGTVQVSYTLMVEGPATCTESAIASGTTAVDADTPAPGTLHTFLVSANNPCGAGTWGTDSSHQSRLGCPEASQIVVRRRTERRVSQLGRRRD